MKNLFKVLVVSVIFVLALSCTVFAKSKEDYDYSVESVEISEDGGVVYVEWTKPQDATPYHLIITWTSERTGNEKKLPSKKLVYSQTNCIISADIAAKGVGTYSVEIRPDKNKEASATSDELEVDGAMLGRIQGYVNTGMTTAQSAALDKWTQDANGIWHLYRNGVLVVNDWALTNGRWYLFDAAGNMLTGWQQKNNKWYYLEPYGNNEYPQGALYVDTETPDGYRVNANGEYVKH